MGKAEQDTKIQEDIEKKKKNIYTRDNKTKISENDL